MDPDLLARLFGYMNPVPPASAQMLGPNIMTPPAMTEPQMPPAQGLDLPVPAPIQGSGATRAMEFPQPGPRLDLAAQAVPQAPEPPVGPLIRPDSFLGSLLNPPTAAASPPSATTPAPAVQPAPPAAPVGSPYQEAYRSTPMPAPTEDYRTQPAAGATPASPSLGSALEPSVPTPRPRPTEAPKAVAASKGDTSGLLDSLKGVKMPAKPEIQKITTPHAPQIAKIQGGALADLLASLGIGPQQALPGLKLPSTLGQALGGK